MRVRTNVGNSTWIEPVVLGKVADLEDDAIGQSFTCITCGEAANIIYNVVDGIVTIPGDTPTGSYIIELILSDDNVDSQREKYSFKIAVQEPFFVVPSMLEQD